mmetsp:Transcript_9300/g.26128  ORF Transcript_9300/g.26128 Transcript_9300/m.26128 type:complete len:340 (-) Transcript_9300:85-1104(-)
MKQHEDATNTGVTGTSSKGTRSRTYSGRAEDSARWFMKILAPEAVAAAIIGRGGSTLAWLRQSCQASITISGHGELYPETDCRVMIVQAASRESLNEVSRKILSKLQELPESRASSDAVRRDGELKLNLLVPRAAIGGMIGRGGFTIRQISEMSGATISISDAVGSWPGVDQLVAIVGPALGLQYVISQVVEQIEKLNQEPWFSAWASATGPAPPGAASGPGLDLREAFTAYPGVDVMMQVARGLPPHVLEDSRGYALSCVVPCYLVGALMGRKGAGKKEVQRLTSTEIAIRDIPDDQDNLSLNITGPLPNACTAYMLMMKRYLDAEAQAAFSGRRRRQ